MEMKLAVIDIGSNSVRLLLVNGEDRRQLLDTTRLGEGATHGSLTQESMERTRLAIVRFAAMAKEAGVPVHAFATSAVRDAANAHLLLESVQKACGLSIDVLSGKEEALAAFLGAVGGGSGAVIDIGGNSTELAVGENGVLQKSHSMQLGAVRLNTLFGNNRQAAEDYARKCLLESGFAGAAFQRLMGIGGTVTSLAAYRLGLKVYDPALVDGCELPLGFVRETVDRLWDMSPEERALLPGISKTRAQIIHQGALTLLISLESLKMDAAYASVHDNLEGYAVLRGLR